MGGRVIPVQDEGTHGDYGGGGNIYTSVDVDI
jgi:hypothetical protein